MTSTLDRPGTSPREEGARAARVLPPPHRSRFGSWLHRHARTFAWSVPAFVLGLIAQVVNLGGSPQRIDDEGTYTAQAWAVDKLGELAHYTYWYDHPPLGWLQLAGYAKLTAAFDRYDVAVVAGREFMVVCTMVGAVLLFVLARRLRFSRGAATAAMLLFTLSPLALQFHRQVYLDTIATPWLIASLMLALGRRRQLASFVGSAACFGVAVLTKETFLLLLPLVAWLMWRNAHPSTRRYTLSVAAAVLVLIGFSYVLLALVKGELTPGGDRVSLVDGIMFQLGSRQSSGSVADPDSLISKTLGMWWQLDPVGIVAAGVAAVGALFVRRLRPFAIALLALAAFMFRPGGYLPVPYVIALLPLGALLIPGAVQAAGAALRRGSGAGAVRRVVAGAALAATVAAAAVAAPLWATQLRGFVAADLDQPVRDAQAWVEQNVSRDSRLIVDDSMWVDLVDAGFDRDNVIWYYKLDTDPAVMDQSPEGWRDADYVITTDSMRTFPNTGDGVNQAIDNSLVVASFGTGAQQVDIRKVDRDGIDQANTDQQQAYADRATAGQQLAANPSLTLDGEAESQLSGGQVDSRLIVSLGSLLAAHGIEVSDFPAAPGEGDPRRLVLVAGADGVPVGTGAAADPTATTMLVDWFDALEGTVAVSSVTPTDGGVLVELPFGEPTGLLPRVAS